MDEVDERGAVPVEEVERPREQVRELLVPDLAPAALRARAEREQQRPLLPQGAAHGGQRRQHGLAVLAGGGLRGEEIHPPLQDPRRNGAGHGDLGAHGLEVRPGERDDDLGAAGTDLDAAHPQNGRCGHGDQSAVTAA